MVAFFPKERRKHLRTANVVESPLAAVRLRTDAAKRFKKTANATTMSHLLLAAEKSIRRDSDSVFARWDQETGNRTGNFAENRGF